MNNELQHLGGLYLNKYGKIYDRKKLTYLDFQVGYHGFESRLGQDNFRPLVCLSYTPHALRQVLNGQGGAW